MNDVTVVTSVTYPSPESLALVADVQYHEPYLSAALNRKFRGIVDPGFYAGFFPKPGGGMNLLITSVDGDKTAGAASVNIGEFYQVTIQQRKDISLALSAGKKYAIVLKGRYLLGEDSYQVNTASHIHAAEFVARTYTDSYQLGDGELLVCTVNIPAGVSAITKEMIDVSDRIDLAIGIEISDSVTSTRSDVAASSLAVKKAYDLAKSKYTAQDASTTQKGLVQLSSATNSDSETMAATPKAVKSVKELADTKAPIESPSLTGTPTAPTAAQGTNSTQIANTAFVKAAITALINGAPGTLDTLKEIAAAINNDPNFSTTINNALALKAPLASPALTGIPTAPTAAQGTNNTQIATTAYVRAAISALVGSSPEALDTLNELAAALGNDPNFATTMTNALAGKQPLDATLTALAALATGANKLPYFTGKDTVAQTDLTSVGRDILAKTSTLAVIQYLGLRELGTSGEKIPLLSTANTWSARQTFNGGITGALTGNADTATKLKTARTIGGVAFDGSANINLPGVNTTGNQNTTGNAATATKLQTARTIGGVSFDGTANINLPGVNVAGNQNTSGNAATATKLQTARTINGVLFDGSKNIELTPRSIGTINSTTMSFSGGAGWFKLATVTMPQASSVVYISLIGGAGYNVGSPQQAGISELVLRAGNGNPKGITGALWRRTSVGFTNFAWVNTSGDTYDVYVEIGNHATGVNIQWDYTSNASVTIHTSPTYTANKPTGLTDGTVYVIYSSHIKPTATDVGALPITGGNLNGGLTATGEIISKSGNGLRIAYGNYGFFIRNDGSNTYFMLTDSGNSLGTYNRLRPLIINNANGAVTIGNGLDVTGGINGSLNGNASTATKLQTARKISGVSFDGSADITLTAENVSAFALRATGTYADTSGAVPWNAESGAYNVTRSGGSYIVANFYTGVGSCRTLQIRAHHKNGGLYYRSSRDGYGFEEGWAQIYTKKDSIPGVNTTGNQNTTGNAATATKLQTARTIGGVSFDGSANINLPGVNTTGNQNTTGNAATATKLQTARNINGVPFDGTKDITLTPKDLDAYSKSEVQSALAGKQPLDNTLTNLSGKDVAGLLAYLQLGEAAKRDVGTGNNQLPDMSAFGMSRNGQTAWDILPNGMIRQVGTVTLTPVGNFNAQVLGGVTYYTHYYRVNFPRQFPNAQIATLATLASYSFSTQSSMAGKSLATHRDTDSGTDVSRTRFTVSYTTPNLGEIPTLHFEAIGY
ncbi:tail fiber protein [Escherichia coli]|uniref:tail fiber protein n=2 Tax=Escherichia coli TaxID=562 RepID=UPI001D080A40|nr:tail fiber protein [Escherichia coli]MCB6263591.1 tail fiber protein [Escherichia coli]MCK0887258.1 tail fiber protein [Escherichia coli]MCK0909377.1 tail fiber protein [Escherichia coli]MDL4729681.1 tail fiber protein [Escherichia coli]CAI6209736.1 tail fiber protein [Escherichia coli]